MTRISATVIAFNEEANIAEALESLRWTDEIVVVDSGSTDATLEICRRYGIAPYRRAWTGYVDQKNYAVEKATNDWILSLDADEREFLCVRAIERCSDILVVPPSVIFLWLHPLLSDTGLVPAQHDAERCE